MSTTQLPQSTREILARRALDGILRAEARRQGMRLEKSRCRTPQAPQFGTYSLFDLSTNVLLEDLLTVDAVEDFFYANREANGDLLAVCVMLKTGGSLEGQIR